jgi:hypothetical protein
VLWPWQEGEDVYKCYTLRKLHALEGLRGFKWQIKGQRGTRGELGLTPPEVTFHGHSSAEELCGVVKLVARQLPKDVLGVLLLMMEPWAR